MANSTSTKPKFYKSLRWRLQAWHAAILSVAIVGFGAVLYFEIRKARLDEIDGEMVAAARTLDGALRGLPPQILQDGFDARTRPSTFPPRQQADIDDAGRPDSGKRGLPGQRPGRTENGRLITAEGGDLSPPGQPNRFDAPEGPDPRPGGEPPFRPPVFEPRMQMPSRDQIDRMLALPTSFVDRYTADHSSPFFMIWAGNGSVLKSEGIPDNEMPPKPNLPSFDKDLGGRQRGALREIYLRGPQRTEVLVGRTIEHEMQSLAHLLWQIVLTGATVIILGLAGGWWLSRRAVAPIETMSATAASISASKLYRRIDLQGIDSELAALGQVLNAMFERLERSFHQQMQFTADASHELRTPLAVVLTNAELALSRSRTTEEYREMIEICHRAARRMKVLVDDLLTLARADAGRLELQAVPLDLRQLAEECVALVAPLSQRSQVAVHVEGVQAVVVGDYDRLAQVITNLLSNAVRHTPAAGRILIRVQCSEAETVLSVADTGIGIPAADLPHVFDRFSRVDKARTHAQGGTGLGLAICKSIVESHGGSIEIASQVDRGTTVVVRFPAANVARPAVAQTIQFADLNTAALLGENL